MLGILMQISRFGFLALLWWFIFRTLKAIHTDMLQNNVTLTKSRLSQTIPNQLHPITSKKLSSHSSHESPLARTHAASQRHNLVITAGPDIGEKLPLEAASIFIGRSSNCTIVLNDDFISPIHAKLSKSGEQWYLEDLGSTNGTFIDSSRIVSSVLVPFFTPIRVGKTVFELQS